MLFRSRPGTRCEKFGCTNRSRADIIEDRTIREVCHERLRIYQRQAGDQVPHPLYRGTGSWAGETREDEVEEVREVLSHEMQNACGLAVKLEIDLHTGADWYEAK